jgi:hypothetical protein
VKVKKKILWGFSFFTLALFSLYALMGTFGLGTNKAYAQTLSKDDFYKRGRHFVALDKAGLRGEIHGSQEICTLHSEQVAELDAFFNVRTFEFDIKGEEVTVAAVQGRHLTKKQLMQYLKASDEDLQCQIVHRHKIFFFPVVPQVS